MRRDIGQDPWATHYCGGCGLTMRPNDRLACPVADGDLCQAKARSTPPDMKWARRIDSAGDEKDPLHMLTATHKPACGAKVRALALKGISASAAAGPLCAKCKKIADKREAARKLVSG